VVTDAPTAARRPQFWRISDRRTFQALRRSRTRARSGCCTVTWLPPTGPDLPPRAGFVVGKSVGGAVVRNRIRRRLRAALRELQASDRLPGGTYLLGATAYAASLPWTELLASVHDAVSTATKALA
jgi:ribonuclease P protein component